MTLQLELAFGIAYIITAIIGFFLVPWLRSIKAGQSIKRDGPTWHMSKDGTPTMGGLMFIGACVIICFTVGIPAIRAHHYGHLFCLLFALVYGAIGFLDDFEKLKHKENLGLRAWQKSLLQLIAAVLFIYLLKRFGYIDMQLYIPFWNKVVNIPEVLYVLLAAFIIVGTVNAVNLTDGVDGLASGASIPVCLFFTVMPIVWHMQDASVGIFAAALSGGLMGFLLYNFNPAKVFMGDTGSLFLGGAIAAMAFAYNMPLILVTLGILYIIEALSDIIQVGYFKATHGKRVFKMAPFHHHLEMGGWTGKNWSEKELFTLYVVVSIVFAVISYFGVRARF